MAQPTSVKVSSRYQIAVPRIAREQLNIQKGDRLLVDVQDGLLILLPQPKDYTSRLSGLHREAWAGLDTDAYLGEERGAWTALEGGSPDSAGNSKMGCESSG
jgi:AbrB family looped-hinge helix DNA binding protein